MKFPDIHLNKKYSIATLEPIGYNLQFRWSTSAASEQQIENSSKSYPNERHLPPIHRTNFQSVPSLTTTVNNDRNKLKKQMKCRNTLDLPVIQFNDALFSYNKRLQKSNKNNTKPPKHLEKNVPETSIFDGSNSPLLLTMAQLNPNLEHRFENKSSDVKEKQPSSSRLSHISMVRSTDGKNSINDKTNKFCIIKII